MDIVTSEMAACHAVEASTVLDLMCIEPDHFAARGTGHTASMRYFLDETQANHPMTRWNPLSVIPAIGIGIALVDDEVSDFVTMFLGPNAQKHCDKFQVELQEHWQWDEPVTYRPLSEEEWDPLLKGAFMLFLMAESFHPSIRTVLQRARLFGVTAVVLTHHPQTFPADIMPILPVAKGLDFSGSLRAIIGGALNPGPVCIDLGDIRASLKEPYRLVQHAAVVSSANQLHLAAEQALNHFVSSKADLTRAVSLLGMISADYDLTIEDYYGVLNAISSRIKEDCLVIVAIAFEPGASGKAKIVLTAGWS